MAFLTKPELKTVCSIEAIDKITGNDDSIVINIIDESISTMSGYLSKYYDIAAIFAATGANRHKTVVKKLKDIAIYELYTRHTREQNAEAQRRWNEAMKWLENLNTGEFYDRTLPKIPVSTTAIISEESDDIRFGGNTKYDSNY